MKSGGKDVQKNDIRGCMATRLVLRLDHYVSGLVQAWFAGLEPNWSGFGLDCFVVLRCGQTV